MESSLVRRPTVESDSIGVEKNKFLVDQGIGRSTLFEAFSDILVKKRGKNKSQICMYPCIFLENTGLAASKPIKNFIRRIDYLRNFRVQR